MQLEHNSHSAFYRDPFGACPAGDDVRLRLGVRGGGIPREISLLFQTDACTKQKLPMDYILTLGDFCFYETVLTLPKNPCILWYCFRVISESGERCFYGNNAQFLGGLGASCPHYPEKCFQITVYSPDFQTPEWFRHAVCYQIFPDRFRNGNPDGSFCGTRTDLQKHNWSEQPYYLAKQFGGEYLANDFFGGNLAGISEKLPYLAELGISALYLNPIFCAFSNHKYDTADYLQIDASFGTEEDFCALCRSAEKYGIRIILDGVFNHTGSDSRYFNKEGHFPTLGAYQSSASPYASWFHFSQFPDQYDAWWGMKNLPQIKKDSSSFQNFITDSVLPHWQAAGAYGWRLDVADELSEPFLKKIRRTVKQENPNAVLIGEVWEDASHKESYGTLREYFLGEELDSVMNYPLRALLIQAVSEKITASEFDAHLTSLRENYPKPAFYALLNLLSSHDVERILTALSDAPDYRTVSREFQANYRPEPKQIQLALARLRQIIFLQMLLPGVPCIYYGDEVGLFGYADPFCRNTYPWGAENQEVLSWYRSAIALRRRFSAYTDGELQTVCCIGQGYAFLRALPQEVHVVAVNFSAAPITLRMDLARFGITSLQNESTSQVISAPDKIFYQSLPPHGIQSFSAQKAPLFPPSF